MSRELFHKVPAGAIETLFDEQKQPLFKRADLEKYLGIEKIKNNFKDFLSHYACARSKIAGACLTGLLGRTKNPRDEIVVQSKKPKAVALVKWLPKKGVEKKHEEHWLAITDRDNQIQAPEFRNETHHQKILRLNEGNDDLIANRHIARRGHFENVLCFSKKNNEEAHPYYVIRYQHRQLEKHKLWLKLRYPNKEVADQCGDPNAIHRCFRFKREVMKKPS